MQHDVDLEFGEAIRRAIDRKGWTQKRLAVQIPCQPSLVSQWINGTRPPTREHVLRMLNLLDDVEFSFAVARWSTGGQVGILVDGIEGGRAGAAIWVQWKTTKVIEMILHASRTILGHPDASDHPEVIDAWVSLMEAQVAIGELMRRLALEYGLSAKVLNDEFSKRVLRDGYSRTTGKKVA